MSDIPSMISLEEARALVVSHVSVLPAETVPLLDAIGRVAAADVKSDMDVSPFAHAAMDGFAVHASDLAEASEQSPVELDVIADVPAGSTYEGPIAPGRCVRIMTGAALPADVDSVVKYEIVETVSGDGKTGSRVRFSKPCKLGDNVRQPGEEAREGETVVHEGEVIHPAGIGFLAGCGALEVAVRRRPRVAVIPIGSELVEPPAKPGPGHIRNSNGYAMAACAIDAGATCDIMPIVIDDEDLLAQAVERAAAEYDFVVTTGGASNGDFDFIKPVVDGANGTGLACDPLDAVNAIAVKGNVALVDRGSCDFVTKARNVQAAGARGMVVADNQPGDVAGMSGNDPSIAIPSVRITQADGIKLKASLQRRSRTRSGVVASLGLDAARLAGTDAAGRILMYTPTLYSPGSTVSHYTTEAKPNQLMEPAINDDLTHAVAPPRDLTYPLLRDIGW